MKKSVLAIALLTAAGSATAAVSYGTPALNQPYVGLKVGQVDVDAQSKKPLSYGVYGGYNFDKNFGVEAEYQGSDKKSYTSDLLKHEYDVKTYGVYGTYRYHFDAPIYAKVKLGVARTQHDSVVSSAAAGTQVVKHKKAVTKPSGGVGLGFKITENFNVEAGYNMVTADVNQITLGTHLAF